MTLLIGMFPDGPWKRKLSRFVSLTSFRILSRGVSAVITYHNRHNKPRSDGICVANHTTPIDCLVLACDNCYSFVSWLRSLTFKSYCLLGSSPVYQSANLRAFCVAAIFCETFIHKTILEIMIS